MKKSLFFILIFLSTLSAALLSAGSTTPGLTSEHDPLSIVGGIVNTRNGKLIQIDKDLEVGGVDPIELIRYYDGGHHFSGQQGYGVGLSFPLEITFTARSSDINLLELEQREGSNLEFDVLYTKNKFFGKISKSFLKSGYTNCCEALLRGESDVLGMAVEGSSNYFFVQLGNGGYRQYKRYNDDSKFRLFKERRPNGNFRYFTYIDDVSSTLKRIWTTNRDNSLILNSIDFEYRHHYNRATASNGEKVYYSFKKKKGKTKSGTSYQREALLSKVYGDHLLTTDYSNLTKAQDEDSVFSINEVKRPEGRALKVQYGKSEKIHKIFLEGIDTPLYTFDYHKRYTNVKDGLGHNKRYDFSKKRVVKITEQDRTYHYKWSKYGQLLSRLIQEPGGRIALQTDYSYDEVGNIIVKKVKGTVRHKDSDDCYTVRYSYSHDGGNNLLIENHNDEREFIYDYLPGTNLVTRKLTFADQGFVEREFYQYDQNGIMIQKVIDDGGKPDFDDLTNVTYRKITEIEPQLDPNCPGLTLPRLIKEWYLDPKTNQKHLLKMVENFYTNGDLLSEEKFYDSSGHYCYNKCYEYNFKKQLVSETDALNQKTIYRYDEGGNKVYEEKLGSNKKIIRVYDKANRLAEETEEHECIISLRTDYSYDPMGNRTSIKNHFGQTTSYRYDASGREISVTDCHGQPDQKEYDCLNHPIKSIDKEGYVTHIVNNISGKPLEITYPDGSQKRFTYNLQGHLIQEWERDGRSISYEVDYRGRPRVTKTCSPDGCLQRETRQVYKGDYLIAEIDAKGNEIRYQYDGAGRKIAKIQGDYTTLYEYDSLSNLIKVITAESVEVKRYDFLRRLVEERTEDFSGQIYTKKLYSYDINDNKTVEKIFINSDEFTETKIIFNSQNQPIRLIDGLGNEKKVTYHYTDHLEKETIDSLGRVTVELYDRLNRLVAVHKLTQERKLLSLSAFGYDGRGNKICQIDKILFQGEICGDHIIHTMFDSMGQKTSETEQHEKTTSYTYQNGKLSQIIKPDQVILTHNYDGLGRLKELLSTDGTIHYHYSYDLNDNLIKVEDLVLNLTIERSYDFMNRLIVEKQATGSEIRYTYDALDRIKEVLFEGEKIVYTYNPTEVVSVSRYKNDKLLYTFSQQTDWRGKITHQILPGNLSLSCKWDALGQCTKIESVPFQQTFTYDSVNNLVATKVKDSLGSYESDFSYNDLNQIREEKGLFPNSYSFDSLNNRRNKNEAIYAVNELNQLLSESALQYTYDKNGNRTSKDKISYIYDALNRLTSLSFDGKTIEYKYDSFGRRIKRKTVDETIHYLYQFDTEIAALKNGQIIEFKAIYEPFSAFAIELKGQIYTPIRNHRGDICQLIDLKGNSVSNYRYDAFGQFLFRGKVKSPWTFSGQRYDGETKLYRFLHRDYDSFTGRWLTSDPLGFADGPNLYAYVNNNPWIYVDTYGLFGASVYQSAQETFSSVWNSPRVQGTCQMFTGLAEMGSGGAIAFGTYGAAAPLGFSVAAHGADHFCTGLRSVVSGRHTETVTSQLLQKTGISKETTQFVDNGISMIGTLGGSAAVRSSQAAAFPKYSLPINEIKNLPATSSMSAHLLKNKFIAEEISGGHAFTKHVIKRNEFPDFTRLQFENHLKSVLNNPTEIKNLTRGRTGYWDQKSGTIIIRDPLRIDGGTAFKPTEGKHYFDNILK